MLYWEPSPPVARPRGLMNNPSLNITEERERLVLRAIVVDFDGVIVESNEIKAHGFRRLFRHYPEHVDRIVQIHLDNGAMSRYEKFKIIYRDVLKKPLEKEELAKLGEQFQHLVFEGVRCCPYVPGAYQFLAKYSETYTMFVASGTPEMELREIVQGRGLDNFFHGVYGSPKSKAEILRNIIKENGLNSWEVLFVGDAIGDYLGAQEPGVLFIGRVPLAASNPFPEEGIVGLIENLEELDLQWGRFFPARPR